MKSLRLWFLMCVLVVWGSQGAVSAADPEPFAPVTAEDRCPVCGMFVAKYSSWVTQVRMSDGSVAMFDGPKDMLVYVFSPSEYGAKDAKVLDLRVKDYYTQKWLDGRQALYVTGSDVYGPMGHEFVPFDSREAAENFLKDHHGTRILTFEDITLELVQRMQMGHKMKGHMDH